MEKLQVAMIGAGSRSFSGSMIRDFLLDKDLANVPVSLRLMDVVEDNLKPIHGYLRTLCDKYGKKNLTAVETTDLGAALDGADFVIVSLEVDRYAYWTQDFHVPRMNGSNQIYGENGGPGSLFHALRNMGPVVNVAREMERLCPGALLLNFSNPEHKLCEAVTRLTKIRNVGLCHGIGDGWQHLSIILGMPIEKLDTAACGINHFTWFQKIRHADTGEDLYPLLREREPKARWMTYWDELALGRILFRRFGLWPSPGTNHYGEYIRWAHEFWMPQVEFFYDHAEGPPWENGHVPDFFYSLSGKSTIAPGPAPWIHNNEDILKFGLLEVDGIKPSGEQAVPIIASLALGIEKDIPSVNIRNNGSIPNLPEDLIVEVPAVAGQENLRPVQMDPLPEPIACLIRTQASIHRLLVEAFAEQSRDKLLQCVLLDPTVDSYRGAVNMVDQLMSLQRGLLPEFK